MNTNNKHFKNLLKEIASHTSIGRILEADVKQKQVPDQEDATPSAEDAPDNPSVKTPQKTDSTPTPPPTKQSSKEPAPVEQPSEEPASVEDAPEKDAPEEDSIESTEKAEAEDAIENVSFVKLNSDSGIKFLLNSIIQPAIETNTLDSIAQDFAEKLNIKTIEDLNKFKDSSIQFKSVVGFDQILTAMESFVNG